jgi:hypothetical protein
MTSFLREILLAVDRKNEGHQTVSEWVRKAYGVIGKLKERIVLIVRG